MERSRVSINNPDASHSQYSMNALFRSFLMGMGGVLSIYPCKRSAASAPDSLQIIGHDFARVGADIQMAIDLKATQISPQEKQGNGKVEQAEQLELIKAAS